MTRFVVKVFSAVAFITLMTTSPVPVGADSFFYSGSARAAAGRFNIVVTEGTPLVTLPASGGEGSALTVPIDIYTLQATRGAASVEGRNRFSRSIAGVGEFQFSIGSLSVSGSGARAQVYTVCGPGVTVLEASVTDLRIVTFDGVELEVPPSGVLVVGDITITVGRRSGLGTFTGEALALHAVNSTGARQEVRLAEVTAGVHNCGS